MASRRDEQAKLIAEQQATIAELRALIAELRQMFDELRATHGAREAELVAKLEALQRKVRARRCPRRPRHCARGRAQSRPGRERSTSDGATRSAETSSRRRSYRIRSLQRIAHAILRGPELVSAGKPEWRSTTTTSGYFRRRVHEQEVLVCPCCQTQRVAQAPKRPFDKSPYGPGLVAHVIVQKCACSVPIYRLEKQFNWLGIPMSRSTMTDLFHLAAEKLRPLYQRLLYRVAHEQIVLADETTLKMQERGKRGYMWTFRAGKLVTYKFAPSRSGATPSTVLGGTTGTLVVDAYSGYNAVVDVDGRVRAGRLAHVRRKFSTRSRPVPERRPPST